MTSSFFLSGMTRGMTNRLAKNVAQLITTTLVTKAITAVAIAVLLLSTLQSCATTASMLDPEQPKVTLEKIKPLSFNFNEQKLELTLNVENPNAFSLPLNTLNFAAMISGEHIADGTSRERVTIPANGTALLNVVVTTSLSKLIGIIQSAADEGTDLNYNVKGKLKLDNWPKMIPFDSSGKIDNPLR